MKIFWERWLKNKIVWSIYIGKNWQASEICEPQFPEKQCLPPKSMKKTQIFTLDRSSIWMKIVNSHRFSAALMFFLSLSLYSWKEKNKILDPIPKIC